MTRYPFFVGTMESTCTVTSGGDASPAAASYSMNAIEPNTRARPSIAMAHIQSGALVTFPCFFEVLGDTVAVSSVLLRLTDNPDLQNQSGRRRTQRCGKREHNRRHNDLCCRCAVQPPESPEHVETDYQRQRVSDDCQ